MTSCIICRNPDMRRLVELGWNAKMTAVDIAHAFGMTPSVVVIRKHLNEHRGDGLDSRTIPIEDVRSTRVRIEMLQKRMLDDIEARVQWADDRAAEARAAGNADALPSDWFNVLDPKVQAAIGSVIKMQDQTDKREGKKASVAVDLMKLMGGTPPPSHLIEDGVTVEGEATEVDGSE